MRQILEFARVHGAKSVVLDTGLVVNPSISGRIHGAIKAGKPILGGKPRLVGEVPSIISGEPNIPRFEITFN